MAAAWLDSGQWSVDIGQWLVVFVFCNSCLFFSVYGLDMGIYICTHSLTHSLIHCDLSLFCLFVLFVVMGGFFLYCSVVSPVKQKKKKKSKIVFSSPTGMPHLHTSPGLSCVNMVSFHVFHITPLTRANLQNIPSPRTQDWFPS